MKRLDSHARTTEVDDTSDRLLVLYRQETSLHDDVFLKRTMGEIEEWSAEITEAINRDKIKSELEEADRLRDNAVRSFASVLKGYAAMPLETISVHGKKLYDVFQKYGLSVLAESYGDQSSLIESMLMDFNTEELKPHIAALTGVTEAIANVRDTQTSFTHKRVAYEKAIAGKGQTVTEIKQTLLKLINQRLVTYLKAMKLVDEEKYTSFVNTAAQIIEATNAAIYRRRGKGKSKSET